ncbi:MAG: hypothetical protein ACI88H_001412 [Cocleimonas sp.]
MTSSCMIISRPAYRKLLKSQMILMRYCHGISNLARCCYPDAYRTSAQVYVVPAAISPTITVSIKFHRRQSMPTKPYSMRAKISNLMKFERRQSREMILQVFCLICGVASLNCGQINNATTIFY